MDKGLRFAIREGGRTVGAGQVTEIAKGKLTRAYLFSDFYSLHPSLLFKDDISYKGVASLIDPDFYRKGIKRKIFIWK
jgi:hypothetical protein